MSIFSNVPIKRPKRSLFNLSHEKKFSCRIGKLVPIFVKDTVPGDRFDLNTRFNIQFAPLIAPLMHNIDVYVHYFYVPYRILNKRWQEWIFSNETVSTNVSRVGFLINPFFKTSSSSAADNLSWAKAFFAEGSLSDFLEVGNIGWNLSAVPSVSRPLFYFPYAAYHAIWLNYYRDENLNPLQSNNDWQYYVRYNATSDLVDSTYFFADPSLGENTLFCTVGLRSANYIHDYFTSALPFAQRGPTATVPVEAGVYPVVYSNPNLNETSRFLSVSDSQPAGAGDVQTNNIGTTVMGPSGSQAPINYDPGNTLKADLRESEMGISIFDLRRTSRLQEWLEKNAYSGNRPVESVLSHFGVRVPDARLQRPEFLGGGRVPVSISAVAQTSQSTNDSPQANLSGNGFSVGSVGFRRKFFVEHGIIMGIMSIMPRPSYQQGSAKMYYRPSRFDYYWPEFARIGEQPIETWEIYDNLDFPSESALPFGYSPRYSEYKFALDTVHGDFRSSLSFWHAGRIFSSAPVLNSSFLHVGSDIDRIFAVQDQSVDNVYVWVYNKCFASRLMPKYGTPIL